VDDIAGVDGSRRFEEQNFRLLVGAGAMLDAARDDNSFPGAHLDNVVAEFDAEPALPDEEKFVFLLMPMPRKLALDLDELDLLPIHRCDHLGPPLLVKEAELLIEIDFGRHPISSFSW
jgi:hypothetical protein